MSTTAPASTAQGRPPARRHLTVLLVAAVVGGLVGLGLALFLPSSWSATTSVLVTPLEGNPYNPSTQGTSLTNLETEAQIAGSEVVGSEVVSQLGLDSTPLELGRDISVTLESNTQIVKITYSSSKKSEVKSVSEAYADAYLAHRADRRDAAVQAAQGTIDDRIATITNQLNGLRDGAPGAGQKRRALGGQLLNLRVQSASIASDTGSPGEVIATATPHRTGLSVPAWVTVLAGVVVGLLIGLVVVASRSRRSTALGSE